MKISLIQKHFASLPIILLFTCCISPIFNQKAYEQTTSLKAEALMMMDKASEPYVNHKQEVEMLKLNIEKAYEYVKGLPKNQITAKQWEIIKDPAGHSLGGFLKRWEENSTLGTGFIQEAKKEVSDGFDTIIELEGNKPKSK